MDIQHKERTMRQHKFPPKLIETEMPKFSVKVHWFGHVKQSELYTGQILDLEVEGNRSCGCPKKCWLDAIKDDSRQELSS